jgi:hypothetical protein
VLLEHQRGQFKIEEARVANYEAQASAITAAAIKIAALYLSTASRTHPTPVETVIMILAATIAVGASIFARGDNTGGEAGKAAKLK